MTIDATCSKRPIGTLVLKGEGSVLTFDPGLKEEHIDRLGSRELNSVETQRFSNEPSRAD